jgi:hypothetical protein
MVKNSWYDFQFAGSSHRGKFIGYEYLLDGTKVRMLKDKQGFTYPILKSVKTKIVKEV